MYSLIERIESLWVLEGDQASQVARVVKNPPASAGDAGDGGSIPWPGRSPGEGNGDLLWYSCLENPMDWQAAVHRVTESDVTRRLSTQTKGYISRISFFCTERCRYHKD